MEVLNMEDNNNINVNEQENTNVENNDTSKTFTQEEVMKLIQTEADKRVTSALKKQADKYEKKLSLSTLDETERGKAEAQMKIQELQEQLASFQLEKNRSELKSVLSSRGLSAEFADIVNITDDIEASQANIDKLDKLFKSAVKAEVEKRLAGNSPKENLGNNEIAEDDIKKMSLSQLTKLQETKPELFEKYFK